METLTHTSTLVKELVALLMSYRVAFGQQRVHERAMLLALGEV